LTSSVEGSEGVDEEEEEEDIAVRRVLSNGRRTSR